MTQKQPTYKSEQRDPRKLKPAAYNPRKMPEEERVSLKRSLQNFGQAIPIIINTKDEIIGGHQTTEVAIDLGMEKVDVRVVTGLSAKKERVLNIALNRIKGTWDEEKLANLIATIAASDENDLMLTGFGSQELDEMIERSKKLLEEDDEDGNIDLQEAHDAIKNPETKPGDIIELGDHRIICGDGTNADTYRTLLKQNPVDMIFTDPPYNVAYNSRSRKLISQGKENIQNDKMSRKDFADFSGKFMHCFNAYLKPGGVFYICTGWSSHPDFVNAIRTLEDAWNISGAIIWDKRQFTMGWQDYRYQYEMIIYGFKNGEAHYFIEDRKQSDLWDDIAVRESSELPEWAQTGKRMPIKIGKRDCIAYLESKDKLILQLGDRSYVAIHDEERTDVWRIKRMSHTKMVHPTEKPVALAKRAIINSSKRGETVLDAFSGSGSTLMACEATGRKFVGIEMDPKWCDVIKMRWDKYTQTGHAD